MHRVVFLFTFPAFAGTHCACSQRDGQAEWLVLHRDGLTAIRRLAIEVVTGPGVAQFRWSRDKCVTN